MLLGCLSDEDDRVFVAHRIGDIEVELTTRDETVLGVRVRYATGSDFMLTGDTSATCPSGHSLFDPVTVTVINSCGLRRA